MHHFTLLYFERQKECKWLKLQPTIIQAQLTTGKFARDVHVLYKTQTCREGCWLEVGAGSVGGGGEGSLRSLRSN